MNSKDIKTTHFRRLSTAASEVYYRVVVCLRWIVSPVRRLRTLLTIVISPHLWFITGSEITSNAKFTIAFAGHERSKNLFANLAFGDSAKEYYCGRKWLWNILKTAEKAKTKCSLVIVEVPNCFRILCGYLKCLYIPNWVDGEINISTDTSLLFKNKNSSLKSDLSKIRRNEYTYEVTTEISKLWDFYHNMYVPFIKRVHGNRSKIMSYGYVKRHFAKYGLFNELLLVKEQENYVAGVLLYYRKNKAKISTLGVRDGELSHVKNGVIGALYYFSFLHFQERGFAIFDLGGSRPFLKDGVLRYKRKWNQKIYDKKEVGFLVKAISETDGLKGFLLNNPFIYEDKTGLNGAIFVEKHLSEMDIMDLYKEYYVRGLSRLFVYRFNQDGTAMSGHVPCELSKKIQICSADSILQL